MMPTCAITTSLFVKSSPPRSENGSFFLASQLSIFLISIGPSFKITIMRKCRVAPWVNVSPCIIVIGILPCRLFVSVCIKIICEGLLNVGVLDPVVMVVVTNHNRVRPIGIALDLVDDIVNVNTSEASIKHIVFCVAFIGRTFGSIF